VSMAAAVSFEREGQVLRAIRLQHGLSQECVGMLVGKSRSWTNQVEQCALRPTPEALVRLGVKLHDGRLIAQAVRQVTGGAFAPPVLDGEAVDLHRTCVAAKLVEEIEEALLPARRLLSLLSKPVKAWTQAERAEIEPLLEQCLDAERAIQYIAIAIAAELKVDVTRFYRAHDEKLRARGYTKETAQLQGRVA
jgi:transcriptional regulator with XRE-family HTH domain